MIFPIYYHIYFWVPVYIWILVYWLWVFLCEVWFKTILFYINCINICKFVTKSCMNIINRTHCWCCIFLFYWAKLKGNLRWLHRLLPGNCHTALLQSKLTSFKYIIWRNCLSTVNKLCQTCKRAILQSLKRVHAWIQEIFRGGGVQLLFQFARGRGVQRHIFVNTMMEI